MTVRYENLLKLTQMHTPPDLMRLAQRMTGSDVSALLLRHLSSMDLLHDSSHQQYIHSDKDKLALALELGPVYSNGNARYFVTQDNLVLSYKTVTERLADSPCFYVHILKCCEDNGKRALVCAWSGEPITQETP